MKPYQEKFPVGTAVRVGELEELEHFRAQWRFHHPLESEQLTFAGRSATIATVGFYHGGDVLYTLEGVSGFWHEQCVHALDHSTRTA
jgi:hypothetical protein